jgi:FkbM family methyltransferase
LNSHIEHYLRILKHCYLNPEPEMVWLKNLKISINTAIDCGANRGYISHVLASHADQVFSFEPIPYLAEYLTNVLPKNCQVINSALSDFEGHADLKIPVNKGREDITALATLSDKNVLKSGSDVMDFRCVNIPVVKLETFSKEQNLSSLDYLKIDVEGNEGALLRGAWALIEQFEPIIQIEIEKRHGSNIEQIFTDFKQRGYLPFRVQKCGLKSLSVERFIGSQDEYEVGDQKYLSDVIFVTKATAERHDLKMF